MNKFVGFCATFAIAFASMSLLNILSGLNVTESLINLSKLNIS